MSLDRSILDCALGRLGLPDWFRRTYFSYHSQVDRLRFKVAAGLGEPFAGLSSKYGLHSSLMCSMVQAS